MNEQHTLLLHALPGATNDAYFRPAGGGTYTILAHPSIFTSGADVLAVHISGMPVKFVVNEDRSLSLPPMRLEAQRVQVRLAPHRVTLRGESAPLQRPISSQATLASPRPRLARQRPSEALPGHAVRQPAERT